jgi:hypothetical protein
VDDGGILKDLPLLLGKLGQGTRPTRKQQLCYKEVYKSDLKALRKDLKTWEALASESSSWRSAMYNGLTKHEETFVQQSITRSQRY